MQKGNPPHKHSAVLASQFAWEIRHQAQDTLLVRIGVRSRGATPDASLMEENLAPHLSAMDSGECLPLVVDYSVGP